MDSLTPSTRVIEAVAKKEDVSPIDLLPPLYDAIDPDALDALFQMQWGANAQRVEVEFTYRNYLIRVQNTPKLDVTIRENASSTVTSAPVAND